ncbi:MAG: methylated-DNA--[protein]-cysteine S-methyltransferase [Thermodesulfobacteriota bacterium]
MFWLKTFFSPLGTLHLTGTQKGLCGISFTETRSDHPHCHVPDYMHHAVEQLQEYLQGRRRMFDIPLDLIGTRFQLQVWQALGYIGYGQTASYKEIARRVGRPRAARAVGGANNKNPLPIVVPCHRVIGHNGRLVGYESGLWRKIWLLRLEGACIPGRDDL